MKISILGCGWLGLPLAKHLISQDFDVKGSTTSPEKRGTLRETGIEPYLIKLTPNLKHEDDTSSFWNSDLLFLNIPSRTKGVNITKYHPQQVQSVINEIKNSPVQRVIFISSTSVYPHLSGLVTEEDVVPGKASRNSGNALIKAERMLLNDPSFETTVVRFGGLIGDDRNPVAYLAGKKDLPRANAPVNLIHRKDCIAIITQIIEQNITGEVFNAVCDDHPSREEYYRSQAKQLNINIEPPVFERDNENRYKIVSNEKLKTTLNYSLKKVLI